MKRTVIFGAGGLGREIWSYLQDGTELAFCDDGRDGPLLGIPIIRTADLLPSDELVIAVADPATRKRIEAKLAGHTFRNVIDRSAFIAADVEYGEGAVFCPFSYAGASAKIGRQVLCHIYGYIGHENVIGDHVTVGPRASLNGNVTVGDGAYIGSGAIIRQGLTIGEGAFVGMGAVVVKDVAPYTTVAGNPARVMDRPALKAAS